MTKEELKKLKLNQRVSMRHLNRFLQQETLYGYVAKIYNGNHQVQVWFNGERKPRVVGYRGLEIKKQIKHMTYGEKLKAELKKRKLTQKEFAEIIGVTRMSVIRWCNDYKLPHEPTMKYIEVYFKQNP